MSAAPLATMSIGLGFLRPAYDRWDLPMLFFTRWWLGVIGADDNESWLNADCTIEEDEFPDDGIVELDDINQLCAIALGPWLCDDETDPRGGGCDEGPGYIYDWGTDLCEPDCGTTGTYNSGTGLCDHFDP